MGRQDQRLWLEQTSLYREQLEAAQDQVRELEAQGLLGQSTNTGRSRRSGGDSSRRGGNPAASRSRRTGAGGGRSVRGGGSSTRRRNNENLEAVEPEPDAAAAFLQEIESARDREGGAG